MTRPTPAEAVAAYRDAAARKSEVERQANKDKTGVFLGSWAINPATGAPVPIFVADYVLMGYGTGAIMAVPAQDARDLEFAHRFGLSVVRTVTAPDDHPADEAWTGDGLVINSSQRGDLAERSQHRRGEDQDHRLAGAEGSRLGGDAVQAARLAVLPATLLG